MLAVRIKHYLPSGNYQVAMVPYIKVSLPLSIFQTENGTFIAIAPPSCSPRLQRLDLGQYGLKIIFCE